MPNQNAIKRNIRHLFLSFQSKLQFNERRFLKKFGVKDVTANELKTLYVIQSSTNLSMSDIADKLKITQGTLTSSINSLEKKGYVVRMRTELDKRIVNLSATKKSAEVIQYYERFHNNLIDNLIADLDEKKRGILEEILDKLNAIVGMEQMR